MSPLYSSPDTAAPSLFYSSTRKDIFTSCGFIHVLLHLFSFKATGILTCTNPRPLWNLNTSIYKQTVLYTTVFTVQ